MNTISSQEGIHCIHSNNKPHLPQNLPRSSTYRLDAWEELSLKVFGKKTLLEENDYQNIIDNFDRFSRMRLAQVDRFWEIGNTSVIEIINSLVLIDSEIDSNTSDIGISTFIAAEEVSVEIIKKILRLLNYIDAYSPKFDHTNNEALPLIESFQNKQELLRKKVIQLLQIFGSPGSIFYLPEEYYENILESMNFQVKQFENSGEVLTDSEIYEFLMQKNQFEKELIRFGKEKRKICIEHMESLLLSLVVSPLKIRFDEYKLQLRESIRNLKKKAPTSIVRIQRNEDKIEPEENLKSHETAIQKTLKIQARLESISKKGKGIPENERIKLAQQIEEIEKKYPEIQDLINATKSLLNEVLNPRKDSHEKKIPQSTSGNQSIIVPPVIEASVEGIRKSKILQELVRSLKGEVGNPSSTCTTNKGSYGDGQFWYNYLLPLFNALEVILNENPDFSLNFSWKKLAEHEKIIALYGGQRFRHWHAILLKEPESSEIQEEWIKLPSLIEKQIGSGGFNKRRGQPLVILTESINSYFRRQY